MTVGEILKSVGTEWIENKKGLDRKPMITVILPTFRRAKSGTFERAVESVIAQSYENWELIIVDDASTDGTRELIRFYMDLDSRISTIRHLKNIGLPSISEYEGYCKAKGEYIAFIFDDNVWEKDHLMLSMKTMLKENVKFTYGITKSVGINEVVELGWNIDFLPGSNFIGNGAVVMHRDIIEDVGFYDPHVVLTRLCDWDLWVRIHRKYEMRLIPQVVTVEYGVTLNDSLGNTVKLNSWAAFERMNMSRNEDLRSHNFDKIDICSIAGNNTDLFSEMVEVFYQQYSTKFWFKPLLNEKRKSIKSVKRVLLLTNDLDATYSLAFKNLGEDVIIRPVIYGGLNESDLIYVDYVLCSRNVVAALQLVPFFKKYGIPFGLYLDDNFIELIDKKDVKEDDPQYPIILQFKNALLSEQMFLFKDIFVSTKALKNYFDKIGLQNVRLLPACIDERLVKERNAIKDKVVIAFMGGTFREELFMKYVAPAIMNLSLRYSICLVCTESLEEQIKKKYTREIENLELCVKQRKVSYEQILHSYSKENINILVHPGKSIENNRYKTENALANAVSLGAILLTSNTEPYNHVKEIITVKNSITDWEQHIEKIINNEIDSEAHYRNQCTFVKENFSSERTSSIIYEALEECSNVRIGEVLSRAQLFIHELPVLKSQASSESYRTQMIDTTLSQLGKNSDEVLEQFLCFSKIPKRALRYTIYTDAVAIKSIGIILAFHEIRGQGEVIVQLLKGKKIVATAKKRIEDIKLREINYFDFDHSVLEPNKVIMKISVQYEEGNIGMVGLYENRMNKKLIYRVFKKVTGIQLPTRNLPYYVIR